MKYYTFVIKGSVIIAALVIQPDKRNEYQIIIVYFERFRW